MQARLLLIGESLIFNNEDPLCVINLKLMDGQIAESQLLDVFDLIKGTAGKQRSCIIIDDFRAAIIKYKPDSVREELDNSALNEQCKQDFNHLVEDLFRNISETVSPTVDVNTTDTQEETLE